jgi:hypothetical protein
MKGIDGAIEGLMQQYADAWSKWIEDVVLGELIKTQTTQFPAEPKYLTVARVAPDISQCRGPMHGPTGLLAIGCQCGGK